MLRLRYHLVHILSSKRSGPLNFYFTFVRTNQRIRLKLKSFLIKYWQRMKVVQKIHFEQMVQAIKKLTNRLFAFVVAEVFVITTILSPTSDTITVLRKMSRSAEFVKRNYRLWKIWIITWRTVTFASLAPNVQNLSTHCQSSTNIHVTMKRSSAIFVRKLAIQRKACTRI